MRPDGARLLGPGVRRGAAWSMSAGTGLSGQGRPGGTGPGAGHHMVGAPPWKTREEGRGGPGRGLEGPGRQEAAGAGGGAGRKACEPPVSYCLALPSDCFLNHPVLTEMMHSLF